MLLPFYPFARTNAEANKDSSDHVGLRYHSIMRATGSFEGVFLSHPTLGFLSNLNG